MQDFRENDKKTIKNDDQSAILNFISAKFVMVVLCESLHFVLYAWCSYFALFLSYVNITKLLKFFLKWPLNGHFKIVWSQKLFRSLADIAVHICQIKRRSAGNVFLKRANEYFFVSGPSNKGLIIWESKCHKKFPGGMWWLCEVWGSRS